MDQDLAADLVANDVKVCGCGQGADTGATADVFAQPRRVRCADQIPRGATVPVIAAFAAGNPARGRSCAAPAPPTEGLTGTTALSRMNKGFDEQGWIPASPESAQCSVARGLVYCSITAEVFSTVPPRRTTGAVPA